MCGLGLKNTVCVRESVCVEKERERVCVCIREERESETKRVCVCEREYVLERVRVCV